MKYYIVIALLLISCQSSEISNPLNTKPITINLDEATYINQPLKLSEIASAIKYITFETSPESLISSSTNFKVSDNHVFISQRGQIKQFDNSGKFVRDLITIGRGPGEGFTRCFTIDDSGNSLYMYSNFKHKILQYNIYSGENKERLDDPEPKSWTENLFSFKDCLVLIFSNSSEKYFFKIYNIGSKKFLLEWPIHYQASDRSLNSIAEYSTMYFQNLKDTLLFKEMFSDTIYQTSDLVDYSPRYIFKSSDKLTFESYHQFLSNPNMYSIDSKLIIGRFVETSNSLFIYGYFQNKSRLYHYDKTKNILKFYTGKEIINDLDKGANFKINWNPHSTIYRNDNIFCMLDPFNDILNIDRTKIKSAELLEIMNNINENSNPVLMVVELKE